jgi:hypothetical protein
MLEVQVYFHKANYAWDTDILQKNGYTSDTDLLELRVIMLEIKTYTEL